MLKKLHKIAEILLLNLAKEVEDSRVLRLPEHEPHQGKVILPDGFEHIKDPGRTYLVWPLWEGTLQERSCAVEFIPAGHDCCRLCLEIRSLAGIEVNLNRSIVDKWGDFERFKAHERYVRLIYKIFDPAQLENLSLRDSLENLLKILEPLE